MMCAFYGHLDCLMALAACRSTNVNACRPNGETALFDACREGHMSCVRSLVTSGADILARNSDGLTAADVACEEVIALYLESVCSELRLHDEHYRLEESGGFDHRHSFMCPQYSDGSAFGPINENEAVSPIHQSDSTKDFFSEFLERNNKNASLPAFDAEPNKSSTRITSIDSYGGIIIY
jgi:hypothetical protein